VSVRALARRTLGATTLGCVRETRGAVARGAASRAATLSRGGRAVSLGGGDAGVGGAGSGPRGGVHAERSSPQHASARRLRKRDAVISLVEKGVFCNVFWNALTARSAP
jgi:hypothetical protein